MIIGIDPGKKGGVAVIYQDGKVTTDEMPTDYELHELLASLKTQAEMNGEPIKCYIEQVYMMSKQQRQIEYVEHSGAIKQSCRVLGIPWEKVPAISWKKKLRLTGDKNSSLILVRDLFGDVANSIGKHDGMAEALLIAYYGKKYM